MLQRLLLCLVLLSPVARATPALDPASDAFKAKFAAQEQILLSGILTNKAQADEFAKDAAAGGSAAAMTKWYGRIAEFSAAYLSKQHGYNDAAAQVKGSDGKVAGVRYMADAEEWGMLMDALRKMKAGGVLDQTKFNYFVGMIDSANDDLSRGDTEAGHKVVDMGRKNLIGALNDYLASPNGKAGIADAARQRQEEEARKKAQQKPPETVVTPAPPAAEVKKPSAEKTASEKTEPTGPVGDDVLAKKAREQAEQIRKDLQSGGNGDQGYTGDKSKGDGTVATVVAGDESASEKTTGLSHSGSGTPNLAVKGPPAPGAEKDDMAELHKMKEDVKGHKTLWATIGGGLLGGIIGGLIGFFAGGPIGLIVGAALGAAAGAFGGHMLGKKLWG